MVNGWWLVRVHCLSEGWRGSGGGAADGNVKCIINVRFKRLGNNKMRAATELHFQWAKTKSRTGANKCEEQAIRTAAKEGERERETASKSVRVGGVHRGTGLTVRMVIAIEPLAKAGLYRPRPSQESKNNTTFIDIYNAFNTGVEKKKNKRESERESRVQFFIRNTRCFSVSLLLCKYLI